MVFPAFDAAPAAADQPVPTTHALGRQFESRIERLSERLGEAVLAQGDASGTPLEAAVAAADAVIDLPPEAWAALEAAAAGAASAGEAPSVDELGQAVRTLLAHAAARRRDEWEHVRDELVATPSLDEDRLYQAHRHAGRKRWLLAHVRLLGTAELVALMPDRIAADRNTARVLARWREEGQVLGVPIKRDWRYPAAQLDARGAVHAALPPVLARARASGYDNWEILYWLARPRDLPGEALAGRPLDTAEDASLEAIAERAADRHADDDAAAGASVPSPFERLAADDVAGFERVADAWLG